MPALFGWPSRPAESALATMNISALAGSRSWRPQRLARQREGHVEGGLRSGQFARLRAASSAAAASTTVGRR